MEADLAKASRAYARLRRETNPNMIFQDVKSHASQGVDLLLRPREAVISEIREDEVALILSTW